MDRRVAAFRYRLYRMDASAFASVDSLLGDDPSDVDAMDDLVLVVVDNLDRDLEHRDWASAVEPVAWMGAPVAGLVAREHSEVEHWVQMTWTTMICHRYFHHSNCYPLIHCY